MSSPLPPKKENVCMICEETLLVNFPNYSCINIEINLSVCFVGDPPCELPHPQAVGAM